MTAIESLQPEVSSEPVSDLIERQNQNYDSKTAFELLDETGMGDVDMFTFLNDIEYISNHVTSGTPEDIDLAKGMYEVLQTGLAWAKNDKKSIDQTQSEAVISLLNASIGDEGMKALEGETSASNETDMFTDAQAEEISDLVSQIVAVVDSPEKVGELELVLQEALSAMAKDSDDYSAKYEEVIRRIRSSADSKPTNLTHEDKIEDTIDDLLRNNLFTEGQAEDISALVVEMASAADAQDFQKLLERYDIIQAKIADMAENTDDYAAKYDEAIRLVVSLRDLEQAQNTPDEAPSTTGEQDQNPDQISRPKIVERMKKRLIKIGMGISKGMNKQAWSEAFDKDNEKAPRNKRIARIVGTAAVGLAVYASYKAGMDVFPTDADGDGLAFGYDLLPTDFDGDGLDLNPFNNHGNGGGKVLAETAQPDSGLIPPAEILAPNGSEIAFADTISSGDGVTQTAQDFLNQSTGQNFSANQMGSIWNDMSSRLSPQEISDMFPGSSVGGEWGVSYSGTGAGGMTTRGMQEVTETAQRLGYLG